MSLMKWQPMWRSFDEDFDRMMREFSSENPKGLVPAMDMYEKDNSIVVETGLPGIKPEDVDVTLENGVLTIKGSTEKKSEVDEKDYWRKEVRTGSFHRQVALPSSVKEEEVKAEFQDGMLTITMPKSDKPKSKKIEISTSKK